MKTDEKRNEYAKTRKNEKCIELVSSFIFSFRDSSHVSSFSPTCRYFDETSKGPLHTGDKKSTIIHIFCLPYLMPAVECRLIVFRVSSCSWTVSRETWWMTNHITVHLSQYHRFHVLFCGENGRNIWDLLSVC